MYGTQHLNNYHRNSKSTGVMWGFVWDPFKKCVWAASFLSSLQQTSRVSYGTHLYKCFRAASTFRVSCGAPDETHLDKCLGWLPHCCHWIRPLGYHEAAYGTYLKTFFRAAPVLSLLLWTLGHRLGPHLVHVKPNGQLPQPT